MMKSAPDVRKITSTIQWRHGESLLLAEKFTGFLHGTMGRIHHIPTIIGISNNRKKPNLTKGELARRV
jgi:hypothetical protein